MAEIVLAEENFEAEVMHSDKPVMIDFWAAWCGPCKMLAPAVAEIAEEHPEIKVGKVNVDEQPALAARFGITGIPTVIVIRDGQIAGTSVGFRPKAALEAMLR